jgi:hypothetical protein
VHIWGNVGRHIKVDTEVSPTEYMRVLKQSANRGSLRVGLDAMLLGSYSAESLGASGTACLLLPDANGVSHSHAIG